MSNWRKWLARELNKPSGFTLEWWSGGIRFTPPAWTWIVLAILIDIIIVINF